MIKDSINNTNVVAERVLISPADLKRHLPNTPECEAVVRKGLTAVEKAGEGIQRRGAILTTLLRLKQVCNHPAHYQSDGSALANRSGKLDLLTEMVEEALAGDIVAVAGIERVEPRRMGLDRGLEAGRFGHAHVRGHEPVLQQVEPGELALAGQGERAS